MSELHPYYQTHRPAMEAAMRERLDLADAMLRDTLALADTAPLKAEIMAEFESHWIGREVEGAQYLPAEAAYFREIVKGVVADQRALDPMIDDALSKGWPLTTGPWKVAATSPQQKILDRRDGDY